MIERICEKDDRKWAWWAGCLLILLSAWRIFYIYSAPIEISPDEAYYWEWSRRIDWGYYSKPPMVAWIIALSTGILGNSPFALRLPAAILGTLSLLFCFLAARKIFTSKTGFIALLLASASPGASLAGFIMTIDSPLLCFWSLALFSVLSAIKSEFDNATLTRRSLWWLITGMAAGAGFLTKQTMFAFWPAVLIFLAAGDDTRKILKSWRLHLSILVSVAAFLPVILWNIRHQWITLTHTAHHFEQSDTSIAESILTFLEFTGSQLAMLSPITWLLLTATGVSGLLMFHTYIVRPKTDPALNNSHGAMRTGGLLLMTGMAILIPITLLSFRQRVNANWPAPFYLAPAIFTAAWHTGFINLHACLERLKKLLKPGIATGMVMVTALYLLPVTIPLLGIEGGRLDPLVRVKGWKELATKVENIKEKLPRPDRTFIITRRRQTASTLAFYMRSHPRLYRWNGNPRRISTQYELWPGPSDKMGWDALIIVDAEKRLPSDLPGRFKEFQRLDQIIIRIGQRTVRRFNLFLGSEFQPTSPYDNHRNNGNDPVYKKDS